MMIRPWHLHACCAVTSTQQDAVLARTTRVSKKLHCAWYYRMAVTMHAAVLDASTITSAEQAAAARPTR
eukprot:16553-Heterococcus_DN1.PRE.4